MIKPFPVVVFLVAAVMLQGCDKWIAWEGVGTDTDSTATTEVNVLDFEAVASTDHEMIQLAIDYAYDNGIAGVFVPAGIYEIDAAGVNGDRGIGLKDGITLRLDPAAVLKAIPNDAGTYSVVRIQNVNNATLTGGTILGERDEHTGTTGEWGMGIDIRDADSITVQNVLIKYCWGDGIYVGGGICRDILIDNVTCDSNRRQGFSLVHADGVRVQNAVFSNTVGTEPQSGMDIEPNTSQTVKNVFITGTSFLKNGGEGLLVTGSAGQVSDIHIENCIVDSNYSRGIQLSSELSTSGEKKLNRVSLSDITISNTAEEGIYVRKAADVSFNGLNVFDSGTLAARIWNSSNVSLDSFAVTHSTSDAVYVLDCDTVTAAHGTINLGSSSAKGFALRGSKGLTLSALEVNGGSQGIWINDVQELLLTGSLFSGQSVHGGRVESLQGSIIENCRFEEVADRALYIIASDSNEITGNTFFGNAHVDNGYSVSVLCLTGPSHDNTISGNTIQHGGHVNKPAYGIWLMGDTYTNTVSSNTIADDTYSISAIRDQGSGNTVN